MNFLELLPKDRIRNAILVSMKKTWITLNARHCWLPIILVCLFAVLCSSCSAAGVVQAQTSKSENDGFELVNVATPETIKTKNGEALIDQIKEQYPCTTGNLASYGTVLRKISNDTLLVQIGQEQKRIALIGVSAPTGANGENSFDKIIGQDVVIIQGDVPFSADNREFGYVFFQTEMLNKEVLENGGKFERETSLGNRCETVLESTARK